MKKKRIHKPTKSNIGEPQWINSGEKNNGTRLNRGSKWQTIHGINLTQRDRDIILGGEWLNDKIIHAAQLMENDITVHVLNLRQLKIV